MMAAGRPRVKAGSGRRDELRSPVPLEPRSARVEVSPRAAHRSSHARSGPAVTGRARPVYNAADEDVDRVYVNGRLVVDSGRVLAADEAAILTALQARGERMWPRMARHDWAGRGADQLSPPTYPAWEA